MVMFGYFVCTYVGHLQKAGLKAYFYVWWNTIKLNICIIKLNLTSVLLTINIPYFKFYELLIAKSTRT